VTPRVDVAIVAYRHYELTRSCIEHLLHQTVPVRITVCDNGCDEQTSPRVAADFPDVQVVTLERNMPYPIACNRAVAAGNLEIVVMMNNDVDVRPDFIERLLVPFDQDSRVGSVATLLVAPGEALIDSVGLVADVTLAGFPRYYRRPRAEANRETPLLTGPAGAAAAFRRCAWQQVGGLDEAIPAYLEDLDLALRLRGAGWKAALALDAVGVHIGSATFGHRSHGQRRRAGFARGYLLRRYRILQTRHAGRALLTEGIVIAGDAILCRDLAALKGRAQGWRAARGMPPRPFPPAAAIDAGINFRDSLRLRRGAFTKGP
jgi:N-acetylglucosaminyl-diphospho-decaprenol L-rhamnosyltransferase